MAGAPLLQLEPTVRIVGSLFGEASSRRRGLSDDIVGSRDYIPGDDIRRIDWPGSARLSASSGQEHFLVRESYGEEAPIVVIAFDRRPSMALYPERFPWLCKPQALRRLAELIEQAATIYHCPVAYLDQENWQPPKMPGRFSAVSELAAGARFEADPGDGDALLVRLQQFEHQLPPGSFVFLLSDFTITPSSRAISAALDAEWELVPVVLRDPLWEQSYPLEVAGIGLPVSDSNGELRFLRQSREQVAARREAHEREMAAIDHLFSMHGYPPVVVGAADDDSIAKAFLDWQERRNLQ